MWRTGSSLCISPCPACNAVTRHPGNNDKRGAIGVRPDQTGWRCFVCDASGTAYALARYADNDNAARDVPAPEPTPPPTYPPRTELGALMAACVPCEQDEEVSAWLRAMRIERTDCAMALAAFDSELPRWATYGGASWQATGHRLIFSLYDHRGIAKSALARCIRPSPVKSVGASGYARKALVMACAQGRAMLAGASVNTLVVVEGEKRLVLSEYLSAGRWATIATGSGLWSPEIAAACGRARKVLVYTDADDAGARYATAVHSSLGGRCELRGEYEVRHGGVVVVGGPHVQDDDVFAAGAVPAFVMHALRSTKKRGQHGGPSVAL